MITRRSLFGLAAGAAGLVVAPKVLPRQPENPVDVLKRYAGRGGASDTAQEAAWRSYCDEPVELVELTPTRAWTPGMPGLMLTVDREHMRACGVDTQPGSIIRMAALGGSLWRVVWRADAGHGEDMIQCEPEESFESTYAAEIPILNT